MNFEPPRLFAAVLTGDNAVGEQPARLALADMGNAIGVVTMPVEIRYFGKKATLVRNAAAFGFSLIVAFAMGVVL